MPSIRLLYCGPYTTSYGLGLLDSHQFLSWLYRSNSTITFVGSDSKKFSVCPLFNANSSNVHTNLGYISDDMYDSLLDRMDAGLSLMSKDLLETHYPSKFFDFCRHKMICISTVDMDLDLGINYSYIYIPCYSVKSLVKSLDEVIHNLPLWKDRSLQMYHTLYSNVHSSCVSIALEKFIIS